MKSNSYVILCVSFIIAPCISEFDISIIDRLSPVLNKSPFHMNNDSVKSDIQRNNQINKFIFTLESSSIDIRLR